MTCTDSEEESLLFFSRFLRGDAATWHQQSSETALHELGKNGLIKFDKFYEAIEAEFTNSMEETDCATKLRTIRMRKINYSEYVTEFRNLSRKVKVLQAILVSWFIAGLPRNMEQILASLRTNTLRDLIKSARGILAAEKQRLTKNWFGPREPTQNKTWEERNQIKQK
jgi:Retrotransposon gag protein